MNSSFSHSCTFHQIAPYIGRLRVNLAQTLVRQLTQPGDIVVDPFVGGGTIALEAAATGRRVIAGDWNPYAVVLTRGKLFSPCSYEEALARFERTWRLSRRLLVRQDLRSVPRWVRSFFHSETLRSALAFREACRRQDDDFLLACFLGILHHERPGFLSFPSSHLVPYLRNRKYPLAKYKALYEERDVRVRMLRKIKRTFKVPPAEMTGSRKVLNSDARRFPIVKGIQAIITSPPYMNELDYVRDNRLRLWFIDKEIPQQLECRALKRREAFGTLVKTVFGRLAGGVRVGGHIALILGDVRGGARRVDCAKIAISSFRENPAFRSFHLIHRSTNAIPDIRRSRRDCEGTKKETLLILQRR